MDKKKSKKKSKPKEKSKEKNSDKINNNKSKKKINAKEKKKAQSKGKTGNKSKSKKTKKDKTSIKQIEDLLNEENNSDTIMITQKLDGNMFVKNKKEEIEGIKEEIKLFAEKKVGTPHFDQIPYIKKLITEKENLIKIKYKEKQIMMEKMRNIFNKLNEAEKFLNEMPAQNDEMKKLYLILNINKKNHINSTNMRNKYKNEYINLLNKNKYNPIEKLNEFGKKINISKKENFEIEKEINKVKMMNISSKYHIKNLTKKDRNLNIPDVNYLTNELLSLNNQKHETLVKLKNNKKIMKSSIAMFENLLKIYNENKIKNQDMNQKLLIKIERDINILKKYLLVKDEKKLYDNIYNDKSLIFGNHSNDNNNKVNIIKLKILKKNPSSNNQIFSAKKDKDKNLEKKKSMEVIKVNSNYLNDSKDNHINIEENEIIKIRLFKKNKLPKIRNEKAINSKSATIEKDENEDNKIVNYDELNESKMDELNFQEMNYKKEHYQTILKKLENSIKDIEYMYKRKIKGVEDILNKNREKYLIMKKRNHLLNMELDNLHKIIRMQVKQFVEVTEKKIASFEPELSNIINVEN